MPVFSPIPLGQRIPASLHAVSCSLPTMRSVRGYEEKNPEITRHLTSGYPRFVVHPLLQRLTSHLVNRHGLEGHTLWLVSSPRMGDRLATHLGAAHVVRVDEDGICGVAHPESPELAARAKTLLQNTGGFLSSRAAEDWLVQHHLLAAAESEDLFVGDPLAEVRRHLSPIFPDVPTNDLLVTNCGMSAIDATFRAISELQATRGRTIWIQLGWLYLDTIALLKKFTTTPDDYINISDVFDFAALDRLFAEKGDRIAGLLSEVPTNPLIQTPDVAAISALAHRHDAFVVLDPSVSSSFDVDVLPQADVVVSSLTKYTASEGDLTAGLIVVNPAASYVQELRRAIASKIEPLYARDLSRLAFQIGCTPDVLARMHASVPKVVAFLESHPGVKEVFWALHSSSRKNFQRVA